MTDREIVESKDNPICDFCSDPHPIYWYPCRDFNTYIGANSVGPWAACETCHRLIESDNRGALNQVSMETYQRDHPHEKMYKSSGEFLEYLHDMFWANRTGPAERIKV